MDLLLVRKFIKPLLAIFLAVCLFLFMTAPLWAVGNGNPAENTPHPQADIPTVQPKAAGNGQGDGQNAENGNGNQGGESTPTVQEYRYNITITFGYLSFLYDWGSWDSNLFAYVAHDASAYPAKGTGLIPNSTEKQPGWYNFDGVNNKISVSSTSTAGKDIQIPVTIEFSTLMVEDDKGVTNPAVIGVDMQCFQQVPSAIPDTTWDTVIKVRPDDQSPYVDTLCHFVPLPKVQFTDKEGKVTGEGYQVPITHQGLTQAAVTQDVYLSFSGAPYHSDGTQFVNTLIQKIGLLILTVGEPQVMSS